MRVYLDNCVLNRSFDDQSNLNVRLETLATLFILEFIEKKKIKLINSSVIEYENSKNPFLERKVWVLNYLSKAIFYQKLNLKIKKRAKQLEQLKIFPVDALHLASAEIAKTHYFITCDYDIIKKYQGSLEVVNPIEFIKNL